MQNAVQSKSAWSRPIGAVDELDEKFQLIATQPLMGRAKNELAVHLRSCPLGRYVIFHAPIEDGIDVVRVLHSARDVDAAFGDEEQAWDPARGFTHRSRCTSCLPSAATLA